MRSTTLAYIPVLPIAIVYLAVLLAIAYATGKTAERRHRSFGRWVFLAVLAWPLALPALLVLPRGEDVVAPPRSRASELSAEARQARGRGAAYVPRPACSTDGTGKRADAGADLESINPFGLGLVLLGVATVGVAVFLPVAEPTSSFRAVGSNTWVAGGTGWILLGLAAMIVVSVLYIVRAVPLFGAILLGLVIASASSVRTLYPVGANGQPDTSLPGTAVPFGIGFYLAVVGAVLAIIGGVVLVIGAKASKRCPDCAETVRFAARVCKYCGHRFEAGATDRIRNAGSSSG